MTSITAFIVFMIGLILGRSTVSPSPRSSIHDLIEQRLAAAQQQPPLEAPVTPPLSAPEIVIDLQSVFHASALLEVIDAHVEQTGLPLAPEHSVIVAEITPYYTIETTH